MILIKFIKEEKDEDIPRASRDDPTDWPAVGQTIAYSPRPQGTAPTHLCRGNSFDMPENKKGASSLPNI